METITNGLSQGDFTRLHILYNGAMQDIIPLLGGGGGGGGAVTSATAPLSITNAVLSLNTSGICSETKWNYHENNLISKPNDECYISIMPVKYFRIKQNLKSLKTCLENQTCFIFGFSVYENFKEMDDTWCSKKMERWRKFI